MTMSTTLDFSAAKENGPLRQREHRVRNAEKMRDIGKFQLRIDGLTRESISAATGRSKLIAAGEFWLALR
jgi:hypothetical protein